MELQRFFFLDFVDVIILKNNKNNSIIIYFQVKKYFKSNFYHHFKHIEELLMPNLVKNKLSIKFMEI